MDVKNLSFDHMPKNQKGQMSIFDNAETKSIKTASKTARALNKKAISEDMVELRRINVSPSPKFETASKKGKQLVNSLDTFKLKLQDVKIGVGRLSRRAFSAIKKHKYTSAVVGTAIVVASSLAGIKLSTNEEDFAGVAKKV